MTADTQAKCDARQLCDYLAGRLSPSRIEIVESHLSVCRECRERLESEAAPADVWSQVPLMLEADEMDGNTDLDRCGQLTQVRSPDRQVSALSLQAAGADVESSEDAAINAAMITREIRGWLDPTDDPKMLGRFAGYEIVGIIGHGGMGIVLKGFEPPLNRFVAIKAMAPRLASNAAARARFAREAQATAAVIHENVIAIYRVDQTHGLPFLVMPYLGGESLQRRIDNEGPLGMEASLRIASQVAAGLSAAHARGLIHRDIKPANILLQKGLQRVTITDFGLARAADDASVTRTGMIAGTPQYMSPEQARACPLDARSDLFSLGSVLYAMLAGRPPFRGETNHEIVNRVAAESPRSISEEDATLPPWIVTLVQWLHQRSADARPKSAEETRRVIDACLLHLQDSSAPLPKSLLAPPESKHFRGRRRVFVSLLLVSCVVAFAWGILPLLVGNDRTDIQNLGPLVIDPVEFDLSQLTGDTFHREMNEIESAIAELED